MLGGKLFLNRERVDKGSVLVRLTSFLIVDFLNNSCCYRTVRFNIIYYKIIWTVRGF